MATNYSNCVECRKNFSSEFSNCNVNSNNNLEFNQKSDVSMSKIDFNSIKTSESKTKSSNFKFIKKRNLYAVKISKSNQSPKHFRLDNTIKELCLYLVAKDC